MPIENKYLHNGAFLTEDELHTGGILLTETTPEKHAVYGKGDRSGQTGTIYIGTRNSHKLHAEFWVKTEEGKFYATLMLILKDSESNPWGKGAESVGLVGYMDVYFGDDPAGAWDMDSGIGNTTLKENFEAVKGYIIEGETYNSKPVTDAGWEYYIDGELVDNPDDYEPTCLLGDMETLYFYHNQMNSTIDVNGSVDAMVKTGESFIYYPTLSDAYAEWITENGNANVYLKYTYTSSVEFELSSPYYTKRITIKINNGTPSFAYIKGEVDPSVGKRSFIRGHSYIVFMDEAATQSLRVYNTDVITVTAIGNGDWLVPYFVPSNVIEPPV